MGFRAKCRFCTQVEFGSMGQHRRHVKWHVGRGDAVVMVKPNHHKPYLPDASEPSLLCKPEEVVEFERQGWTRKATTKEETQ